MSGSSSPPAPPAAPPSTGAAGAAGGNVVTYADGVLQIHDPRATLEVLEWALSSPPGLHQRQWYLGLATCCAQWVCGSSDPVWPAPDVPVAAVERWAVSVARLAILRGDEDYVAAVAAYAGLRGLRRRDALAGLLWRPSAAVLRGIDLSARPMGYLVTSVDRRLAAQARVDTQAQMVSLDDLRRDDGLRHDDDPHGDDELRHAVLITPGIDTAEYLAALRATGRAADLRLAADVERWLQGATQRDLGEAAYRRMMRPLRGQRARVIGGRARGIFPRAAGDGVMAPPEWYYGMGTRLDSVVHRENGHLLR